MFVLVGWGSGCPGPLSHTPDLTRERTRGIVFLVRQDENLRNEAAMSNKDIDYTKPHACNGEGCDFRALTPQGRRNHYRACAAHKAAEAAIDRMASVARADDLRARCDAQCAAEDASDAKTLKLADMTRDELETACWEVNARERATAETLTIGALRKLAGTMGLTCPRTKAALVINVAAVYTSNSPECRALETREAEIALDAEDAAAEAKAEEDSRNRCGYCYRIYANKRNLATHQTRCAARKAAISEARAWEISHAYTATEGTVMAKDNSKAAQDARRIQGNTARLSNAIGGVLWGTDQDDDD